MVEETTIDDRRVFYVDVGDMTREEAQEIIHKHFADINLEKKYNKYFWRYMQGGLVMMLMLWAGIYFIVG